MERKTKNTADRWLAVLLTILLVVTTVFSMNGSRYISAAETESIASGQEDKEATDEEASNRETSKEENSGDETSSEEESSNSTNETVPPELAITGDWEKGTVYVGGSYGITAELPIAWETAALQYEVIPEEAAEITENAETKKMEFTVKQPGEFKVKVTANKEAEALEKEISIKAEYITVAADSYQLNGTAGKEGWYRSAVCAGNTETASKNYKFGVSAVDLLNGNGADCITLAAEGENTFFIQTAEGYIAKGETVRIDTNAPTAKVIQSTKPVTNGTSVEISLADAADSVSGLAEAPYQYDEGEWTANTKYAYVYQSETKEGFSYKLRDKAGNVSSSLVVNASYVDIVPPEIESVKEPAAWNAEKVTYTFQVKDIGGEDYNIVTAYAWVEGEKTAVNILEDDWNALEGNSVSVEALKNGAYTFAIRDKAGNITAQTYMVEKIDTDEPELSLQANNTNPTQKDVMITIQASDTQSGIQKVVYVDAQKEIEIESVDGVYTMPVGENGTYNFKVTDCVGRTKEESITIRNIDRTKPVITVSYDNNEVKNGKYFSSGRTATIAVTEQYFTDSTLELSGITVKNSNADKKTEEEIREALTAQLEKAEWKRKKETDTYTAELVFTEDAEYTFDIQCTDLAGNDNLDMEGNTIVDYGASTVPTAFVIDKTAPVVRVSYNNNAVENNKYFAKERTATITVTDRYFTEAAFQLEPTIVVTRTNETGKTNESIRQDLEKQLAKENWKRVNHTDSYQVTVTYQAEADYAFKLVCTDLADNQNQTVNYAEGTKAGAEFVIDKTKPVVTAVFNNNQAVNGKYFTDSRTVTITIAEHNFDAKKGMDIVVQAYTDEKCRHELEAFKAPTVLFQAVKGKTDVYEATITFHKNTNAFYRFSVAYADLAGNKANTAYQDATGKAAIAPKLFCIDTKAPTGSIYLSNNNVASLEKADIFETYTNKFIASKYGVYKATPVYVMFEEGDTLSGIDYTKLQYYLSTKALTKAELANVKWKNVIKNQKHIRRKIVPGRDLIVYFKIADKAGNTRFVNTNRIVVDGKNPVDTLKPQVSVKPVQPVNGIYNGAVRVAIAVTDPAEKDDEKNDVFSGLKEVSYQIVEEGGQKDVNAYQNHVLFTGKQSRPQQNYEKTITVQNSHDVVVWVRAVDNAGRVTEKSCKLQIDTTLPQVTVSYDNNSADSQKLFKENRTATITVRERNFNKKQIEIQMTKNGAVYRPALQWQTSGNGDDTLHRATISFTEDADYTISDIICTDDAGNKVSGYAQARGTVAGKAFTIDKTKPVITGITFDNNHVQNGMYYKENRTATITIQEHNFDESRVKVLVSASGDAEETPAVTAFTTNGDIHTAVVSFDKDGVYDISVDVADGAGNQAATYKNGSFVIDKTIGKAVVAGITDKSANREKNLPISVSFTDTNLESVDFTLKGDKTGVVKAEWQQTAIPDGYTYQLDYFNSGAGADDMYTLKIVSKDKAGNKVEQELLFSVNRKGSVYTFSEETKALLNAIVMEPSDIVITETNVDEIALESVTIVATIEGGESLQLEKDKHFTVKTVTNGQWKQYVYTIKKENFTAEGKYVLEIMSKDKTSRVNQSSNQETLSFTVDKTGPMLVLKGIDSDAVYNEEDRTLQIAVSDMSFARLVVHTDQLDLTFTAEEIANMKNENGEISVVVPGSTSSQNITVSAYDEAGNETVQEVKNVLITTNMWARFMNNTWLVVGTIVLLLAVIGGIWFVLLAKRKTRMEETCTE